MGEADNYYNEGQQQQYNGGYQQQYQPQPPPAAFQQQQYQQQPYQQQPYQQQPYQQDPSQNGGGYMPAQGYNGNGNEKGSFDQQFKIEKPKYNDLWAGILLILVFAGFVVVSGLALQGYSANKGNAGDGIYGNPNDFSLNTSTVILFSRSLSSCRMRTFGWPDSFPSSSSGSLVSSTYAGLLAPPSFTSGASIGPPESSSSSLACLWHSASGHGSHEFPSRLSC